MARRRTWGIPLAAALAAATLLPVGPFALDPAQSRLEFRVRDNRGGFTGVAPRLRVRATVEERDGAFAADVEAEVDARAITTGLALRDAQMRGVFLQTDRFPTITFRGVARPTDRVSALAFPVALRGELTIRDVTQPVEIPLRVTALADHYLAEGRLTIRLSAFGIPIPRFLVFRAEDPIEIIIRVRLVRP
ncbi:MAG TPA: YceI family protein [bacterium]|nr:YceI family protein [bacterium]